MCAFPVAFVLNQAQGRAGRDLYGGLALAERQFILAALVFQSGLLMCYAVYYVQVLLYH